MKRKIQLRRKVPLEELILFFALLFIASYAFLEHVSISIPLFSMVKVPLLLGGGVCLLTQIKLFLNNIRKKKYFYVIFLIVLICSGLLWSAKVNEHPEIGEDPIKDTNRLLAYLFEVFFLMIWVAESGKMKFVMNFLFRYVLILVLATDILCFTRIIIFSHGRYENYLVGTKFVVAYLHMDLLTLWFIRNNFQLYREGKSKRFAFFATLFIVAVSIRVDCMTGIIGCATLFVLFLLLNTPVQRRILRFQSPMLLLAFLAGSVIFPFVAERILAIPFIQNVVTEVFGRDATLTGRVGIFQLFGKQMTGHWLQGYGYGNGNVASEWLFGCANAQNALLQWVLEVGVPTTLLIVALMLLIFRQMVKTSRKRRIMPAVMLVYVFVILGLVEVTFDMRLILWLALIFAYTNEKEPTPESGMALE